MRHRLAAAVRAVLLTGVAVSVAACAGGGRAVDPALVPLPAAPGRAQLAGSAAPSTRDAAEPERETDEPGWHSAPAVVTDTRTHAWADAGPWRGEVIDVEEFLGENEIKAHRPRLAREPGNGLPLGGVLPGARAMIGAQFPGIGQTNWVPPDPTIAVGPDHIVATVNMKIAFYDKAGQLQYVNELGSAGSPGFFEPAGASWFTFDPKCFYDHLAGRFVVMVPETYDDDESWISIAVSDDDDPHGTWYLYRTEAVVRVGGRSYWWDYPGFGFDGDAYYITGNLFGLDQAGWGGVGFRIFAKSPLLSGRPATYRTLRDADSVSVQAAQHAAPGRAPLFVSVASSNRLRVHAVRDPLGAPRLASADVVIPSFAPPTGAPARGGRRISMIDARVFNAHWRDGQLYTTHHVSRADGRNVARWYRVATNAWPDSGAPSLAEAGEVEAGGDGHAFFPAIYADRAGGVGMVLGTSSAESPVAIAVTGRRPDDPPGAMGSPRVLTLASADGGGRWGDFYDIAIDPGDDRTFWAVGEHPAGDGWATWIGSFTIPDDSGVDEPCAADFSGDGGVDTADLVLFINAWNAGDPRADFNTDGRVTTADIAAFLNAWILGCP